jgi:hypothetical protein
MAVGGILEEDGMRKFVGILALVLALALAAPLAAQDKKSKANDKVKKLASGKVIMVVKLTEISGISYSGIVGSIFMFEIEKVVKFEADKGLKKSEASTFNELLKRSGNLGDYKILEYRYEYPSLKGGSGIGPPRQPTDADRKQLKKNTAAHEKLSKLLKKGRRYILTAPSAEAFCSLSGAVMPNKWGSVLPDSKGEIILEKYTGSTLKKIESLLKEKEEKPSPELEKKIDGLIKKLGNDKYRVREKAQKELAKIGKPATGQLKEALKGKDLEVQKRAQEILKKIHLANTEGLKLTLKANKKAYKKDDKFELALEWKNTGNNSVVVQRKLKVCPLVIFEIKGELAMNTSRGGQLTEKDMELLADSPLTIKAGKKFAAKIKGHGWSRASYLTERGIEEGELRLQFGDDERIYAFKKGKYTITAKTKLVNGTEVRSNTVQIEIKSF